MPDMERIIKEEINRIGSLQERVAFKDVLEQVFLSLYETNREMYENLESRIMDDLMPDGNRCQIITGIVEREYADRSHHLLSLMKEEDWKPETYDTGQILDQYRRQGRCLVKRLFLECDYLQICRLLEKEKIGGTIRTAAGVYPAAFVLEKNTSYLEEITRLYEVFVSNGVCWQTVNAPYLYKYIDVYLTEVPDEPGLNDRILSIEPDLEEYALWAHENPVPLWNVKKLELDSVGFPVPCEDHKNFEHTVSIRDYGNEHVYLIADRDQTFHVRQKENRLLITGKEPEGRRWQVYMIRSGQNRKFERFAWPLMTNRRKDDFPERFWRQQGRTVRTAAELTRFIRGFGLQDYVNYEGFEIREPDSCGVKESYSMNRFLLDEIRQPDFQKCLLLFFRGTKKLPFLERDIMSFLVSEVQLLYPEYDCRGKLL